ncbi:MAG: amino acid adenylation domain-containing protein [Colwellia sp.]|nr:amino acid adenylation domain-containing protein [Colwellia sp.]
MTLFQDIESIEDHRVDANKEYELADIIFLTISAVLSGATRVESETVLAKFDLDISAECTDDGLALSWVYDTSIFSESTIVRLNDHLLCLLANIATADTNEISKLQMVPKQEIDEKTHALNSAAANIKVENLIHEQFEIIAEKMPQNTALVFENVELSYIALNKSSNQLAHYLRERGVNRESLVGICVERSIDMVIGILAILKAGAAYVPLDPNYPQNRLQYIVNDSELSFILSGDGLSQIFNVTDNSEAIEFNRKNYADLLRTYPIDNLKRLDKQEVSDLAYVIYTSGSTGNPKGVLQTHENVVRLFKASRHDFDFSSQDVWTLFHSIAFDFSVWELWGPLCLGGKLVIPSYECTRDTQKFVELCLQQGVTVLNQTPSAFNAFMLIALGLEDNLADLRYVIFGGEALQVKMLLPWWQRYGEQQPSLINMYGITETTVHVTYKRLSSKDIGLSAIGRALRDQIIYLLDDDLNFVPEGAVGEIYVGGAGLARGYLNKPELTECSFIKNIYANSKQLARGYSRLYKTGDLARLAPSGQYVYVGRNDDQVKINGFRIELGEVEHKLTKCQSVVSR